MFRREDDKLVGAITLDNIRHGPAQTGTMGYWIGHYAPWIHDKALRAMVHHAFSTMGLSRIKRLFTRKRCLRGVLEKCGYKYEGVARPIFKLMAVGVHTSYMLPYERIGVGGQQWAWQIYLPADQNFYAIASDAGLAHLLSVEPGYVEERGRWKGQAEYVARPKSTEEVSALVKLCHTHRVAVFPMVVERDWWVGSFLPTVHHLILER